MTDMRQMTALGRGIEDESFAIIDAEAGPHTFSREEWQIVRRVIHATADFEFLKLMMFSGGAVQAGIAALSRGFPVVVDVKMIAAGLNEERLASNGCRVHSFISDADVIDRARATNSTRAIESMRKIKEFARVHATVVLPAHDLAAASRLANREVYVPTPRP